LPADRRRHLLPSCPRGRGGGGWGRWSRSSGGGRRLRWRRPAGYAGLSRSFRGIWPGRRSRRRGWRSPWRRSRGCWRARSCRCRTGIPGRCRSRPRPSVRCWCRSGMSAAAALPGRAGGGRRRGAGRHGGRDPRKGPEWLTGPGWRKGRARPQVRDSGRCCRCAVDCISSPPDLRRWRDAGQGPPTLPLNRIRPSGRSGWDGTRGRAVQPCGTPCELVRGEFGCAGGVAGTGGEQLGHCPLPDRVWS